MKWNELNWTEVILKLIIFTWSFGIFPWYQTPHRCIVSPNKMSSWMNWVNCVYWVNWVNCVFWVNWVYWVNWAYWVNWVYWVNSVPIMSIMSIMSKRVNELYKGLLRVCMDDEVCRSVTDFIGLGAQLRCLLRGSRMFPVQLDVWATVGDSTVATRDGPLTPTDGGTLCSHCNLM